METPYIDNSKILSAEFRRLYQERLLAKGSIKGTKKKSNKVDRDQIFQKTNGCCHMCGAELAINSFELNHVKPNSLGGETEVDNFLPSCKSCNNYRWNYLSDELKWILKLGVWAKTQIEYETEVGKLISDSFLQREVQREKRRKNPRSPYSIDVAEYPVLKNKWVK